MITDKLNNILKYKDVHPLFPVAFEYLRTISYNNLTIGKTEIVPGKVFFIVENIGVKQKSGTCMEIHKKFIDIQVPANGAETFGWKPTSELCSVKAGYIDEKDIAFYNDEATKFFEIKPGQFIIFFPEDAHQPGISDKEHLKIIIKIAV
mgnify:CR=1 FL=1